MKSISYAGNKIMCEGNVITLDNIQDERNTRIGIYTYNNGKNEIDLHYIHDPLKLKYQLVLEDSKELIYEIY